jgi:hypothetical protein
MMLLRSNGFYRIAFAALLLFLVYKVFLSGSRVPLFHGGDVLSHGSASASLCPDGPLADDVVVTVKTGATEVAERIPTQARTTLRCVKNVLYFSDLAQDIDGFHIRDALESISPAVIESNADFDFYRKQGILWQTEHNVTTLKGAKHPHNPNELAAWTLDKYKNVHVVEETWALMPEKKWYIFIDADTYVLWSNLLLWLATMDPNKKTYIGSEVNIGGSRFAHGGSGIILSRATMYDYAVTHNGTAAQWDPKIHDYCCGDQVLGIALQQQGNRLQEVWPMITGETQWTMPFGPTYWCHPQFTMHHMGPAEMQSLSDLERRRDNQSVRGSFRYLFLIIN